MTSSSSAGGRSRSASAARVSCEPRLLRRQGGRRRLVLIATAAALLLGGEGTQAKKDQARSHRHGRQPGRRSDADGTWRATADAAEAGPPRRRIPSRLDQLDPERVVTTAEDAAMADGLAPPYRRRDQDRRVSADRTDGGRRRTGEKASSATRREYSAELQRRRRRDEGEGEGASLTKKDALAHRSLQNDKQQDQKA
eukprot:CAMPEP_0197441772 /NCGR_PEP_ID=MMETSP1175-20131217/7954_1 /TAXON_ID=1003142 /ORGANISM="Triceratium dubium, Strain CCMP147" /LENGTH=196 /DNA_ID=CAMNT_0042972103 /DNA_START=209 /DNA_END=795 /DNA_ORIENTATION=+